MIRTSVRILVLSMAFLAAIVLAQSDVAGAQTEDDEAPVVESVTPADAASTPAQPTDVTAVVTDNESGVNRVNMIVYRSTDRHYWNGTTWTPQPTWNNATTTGNDTWQLPAVDLTQPGRHITFIEAWDNNNNRATWQTLTHGRTIFTVTSNDTTPHPNDVASNLALITANPTRNTLYDDNPFRDVPSAQIAVSDLTIDGDIYQETLLDTTNSGFFRIKCDVSHFAYDDPIALPGQPGNAHLHMFFGNTNANAYSTFDSLMNTGTSSCNGEDLNRTSYWTPALLDSDGNALIPFEIMVYYKNDNFLLDGGNELVSPFPDNFRMLVGDAGATEPQTTLTGYTGTTPVVSFFCGQAYTATNQGGPLIPECVGTPGTPWQSDVLEMRVAFPQCWDPEGGTYLEDGSNLSYSIFGFNGGMCPDSHPEDLSSIAYRIFFDPKAYGGTLSDLHLSSDVRPDGTILPGGTTLHGGWYGAWHRETIFTWVAGCNNTPVDCELGLLGRNPEISLVERKQGFYPEGYRAPAEQLAELCPSRVFDAADPLRSVANCLGQHHGD